MARNIISCIITHMKTLTCFPYYHYPMLHYEDICKTSTKNAPTYLDGLKQPDEMWWSRKIHSVHVCRLAWHRMKYGIWSETPVSQRNSERLCSAPSPIHLCVLALISKVSSGNYPGKRHRDLYKLVTQPIIFITTANENLRRSKPFSYLHIFPWLLTANPVGWSWM